MTKLDLGDNQCVAAQLSHRDAATYRDLYGAFAHLLQRAARRITGSDQDAEDVVQDVFGRLWDHPERFDPHRGAIVTYLQVATRSRSIDLVRSTVARQRRDQRVHDLNSTVETVKVDDQAEQALARDWILAALDGLATPRREAIELAYFSHLTYCEVAEVLGRPEGTVKSQIRAGLRQLSLSVDLESRHQVLAG